jgi:hypothetical protein
LDDQDRTVVALESEHDGEISALAEMRRLELNAMLENGHVFCANDLGEIARVAPLVMAIALRALNDEVGEAPAKHLDFMSQAGSISLESLDDGRATLICRERGALTSQAVTETRARSTFATLVDQRFGYMLNEIGQALGVSGTRLQLGGEDHLVSHYRTNLEANYLEKDVAFKALLLRSHGPTVTLHAAAVSMSELTKVMRNAEFRREFADHTKQRMGYWNLETQQGFPTVKNFQKKTMKKREKDDSRAA